MCKSWSNLAGWLVVILALILLNKLPAQACQCELPTICQAFTRAESVFVGKIISVDVDKQPLIPIARVKFEVEKAFKGTLKNFELVSFKLSDCFQIPLRVGDMYFVYKDPSSTLGIFCNRTNLLADASAELKYARNLSRKYPVFTISGFISNISKEKLKVIKVTVTTPKRSYQVPVDSKGFFNFVARKPGSYEVKIDLSFDAIMMLKNLESYSQSSGRTIEYSPRYSPNACDYREIQIGSSK